MKHFLLVSAALLFASPAYGQETDAITFAAFGDYGDGPGAAAVANLVKGRNVDYIVSTGDNCYEWTPISEQVGDNYGDYVAAGRFIPSLGNHDYMSRCGHGGTPGVPTLYLAYFDLPNNERYYTMRKGPVEFFVADSNGHLPDGRCKRSLQAEWFQGQLAASTAPWKIVVFHKAAFSSGEHGSYECMQWPFEEWGADVVLTGHDHDYERILRDDNSDGRELPYFVSGLGGRSIDNFVTRVDGSVVRYSDDYGSLFARATATTLTFEFWTVGGAMVDSYSMTKVATSQTATQTARASGTPTPTAPVTRSPFDFRIAPPSRRETRPWIEYDIAPLLNDALSNPS